jgi:DNA-binding beta-propeller fold protein YncE
VGPNGDVYVTSPYMNKVFQYTADGAFIRRWGAGGPFVGYFNDPRGIAVAKNGNVYVADTGNTRVQIFTSDGTYVANMNLPMINGQRPSSGVATAPNGDIDVLGSSIVEQFNAAGTYLRYWGSDGSGTKLFDRASALAIGPSYGDVFVLDLGPYSGRIQQFEPNGKLLQVWGNAPGKQLFIDPIGLAVSGNNVVYVVDVNTNRVSRFSSS